MARDGSFVVNLQEQARAAFTVKNKGIRDAFVKVIVKDRQTGSQVSDVEIVPLDSVVVLRDQSQKFEVHLLTDLKNSHSFSQVTSASMLSSSSSASRYLVQLLWGQEAQRRRLKKQVKFRACVTSNLEERSGRKCLIGGLSFTNSKYLNEEKSKKTAAENKESGMFDVGAFELGLRFINIALVDNRFLMSSGRLSSIPPSESVLLEPDETLTSAFLNDTVVQDVTMMERRN
ncbi:unnamed protein product [Enterobius vermicularis]|uniref:MSP domain-containing protein n=1 Tax=Enterobius vermicularis TaxID=51028 RepID=A0A0N4VJG2_ENTVE|nr:unnamed protein product [Enterobius vermicularis]